jgi:hypothetical protein
MAAPPRVTQKFNPAARRGGSKRSETALRLMVQSG